MNGMPEPAGASFHRFCALFYLAMGAVGVLLAWGGGSLALFRVPEPPVRALLHAVALALLFHLLSGCLVRTRPGARLIALFRRTIPPLSRGGILLLAAASGVAEEALFRGALLPLLGLPASTLLFGLMHFPAHRALRVWTLFALAAGLGFALLTLAAGSALPAMLAHALTNALGFSRIEASRRPVRGCAAARGGVYL